MRSGVELGSKFPANQVNVHKVASRGKASCSNSFGILDGIDPRIEDLVQKEKNSNEDGRKGRHVNLPRMLRDDFILEH